jgi:hypothetical protein
MRSEVAGGRHRRPGWRPLVRLLLFLKATDCMLGLVAAASGGLEVTVAISEKVPKHLCKRALSNLEVRKKVKCNIRRLEQYQLLAVFGLVNSLSSRYFLQASYIEPSFPF